MVVGYRYSIRIHSRPSTAFSSRSRRAERAALAAIDAVEGRVLRDQQQFLHAARRQRARFADDRLGRPAAIVAAQRRDDAEGALVVAAFGDLHVGVVPRRRQQPRRIGVVDVCGKGSGVRGPGSEVDSVRRSSAAERHRSRARSSLRALRRANRVDDLRDFAGAQHRVDLGNLRLQLVAIALGHAAGDDQTLAAAVFFSSPSRGSCRSIPASPCR